MVSAGLWRCPTCRPWGQAFERPNEVRRGLERFLVELGVERDCDLLPDQLLDAHFDLVLPQARLQNPTGLLQLPFDRHFPFDREMTNVYRLIVRRDRPLASKLRRGEELERPQVQIHRTWIAHDFDRI